MDQPTQELVKLVLDPDITFGVTVDEDEQLARWRSTAVMTRWEIDPFWDSFFETTDALSARELTGDAARAAIDNLLAVAPSRETLKWTCRALNKNFRAGFDIRTFNSVFDDAVQKFSVQLADSYEIGMVLAGEWLFQPKLDGNRGIGIDDALRSRNGKIYGAGAPIIEEIKRKSPKFFDEWVTDGEVMGDLGFDQSSGALRRISNDKERREASFTYWLFDLIGAKAWASRKTPPLRQRMLDIERVIVPLKLDSVKIVPWTIIKDPTHEQIVAECVKYEALGFEGAMAKQLDAPYKFKRERNLLKIKLFKDVDLRVKGFFEGKGKLRGSLGGLIVAGQIDGKKVRCKVGSGFDELLRHEIWTHKNDWSDAIVAIQHQGVTEKGSLRFPVFLMRRKELER